MIMCVKPIGAWFAENDMEDKMYGRNLLVKAIKNSLILCDRSYGGAIELNEMEGVDSDDEDEGEGEGEAPAGESM